MGLQASQGRMLLLTAKKSDLEYRAQQISQKRLVLAQQLEEIAVDYEDATSNRQMKISLALAATNSGNDVVNRTSNLTYATLVSGTLSQFTSSDSGIQACDRTQGQQYASTSAYRLVDAYGAIVISSEDEIPSVLTKKQSIPTKKGDDGIYRVGTIAADKTVENTGKNYIVIPRGEDGNLTPLGKLIEDSSKINKNGLQVDSQRGIISLVKPDGDTVYYDYKTGAEVTDEDRKKDFKSNMTASLVKDVSSVPNSFEKGEYTVNKVEGADGRFSLLDQNGVVIQRYVVDQTLKYGTTDITGATDGPNYLQECLRNGKYLIEKGSLEPETDDVKWNSLSWDSTSNISDAYYTEDDDRAKAKYDRLQTQIQNQDKKLELELDNIETQRNAVKTEIDSVKKVIDDNVQSTFNTFKA